jgi:hypothetical protein
VKREQNPLVTDMQETNETNPSTADQTNDSNGNAERRNVCFPNDASKQQNIEQPDHGFGLDGFLSSSENGSSVPLFCTHRQEFGNERFMSSTGPESRRTTNP